jgi:glycosyltransferase involved in cell wall biosynthesis
MMKRRTLLEEMGHKVAICSAYQWADFPIPALEFDSEEVTHMMQNLFGPRLVDFAGEAELKGVFDASCTELKQEMDKVVSSFKPDVLFVHNILSLPVHPVATVALTELLKETRLPCAAIHHDILSEGAYKFTPTCNFAKSILERYFPPVLPNLRHWTINSRNQTALKKKGIEAKVIHDTMDFDQKLDAAEQARIRASLRGKHGIKPDDIVLLVGARIVPNKQTELAGHLTASLQSLHQEMVGKKLHHGEVFSEESRVVLVLAGRPERAFADYQQRLFELFDALGIVWIYVGNEVRPIRSEEEGFYALYPDMYTMADFVLYPTGWEGFGNQLVEAFVAGLPVVVFEYPVFKGDIAPKGVKVVSLGDTILEERDWAGLVQLPAEVLARAAHEMIAILTTPEVYRSITAHNIMVGKKHFSFDVLRTHLRDAIDWTRSVSA